MVINELLAYIQNNADIMDEFSLVQLCRGNFNDEEILPPKKPLFESMYEK